MDAMTEGATAFVKAAISGPTPEPWGTPDLTILTTERLPAPVLPADVLPPFWRQWTADAAEAAGAPVAFVVAALLAGAGSVIGNARWASPWQDWKEPPCIWAALVGRPSSGKSPALDTVTGLLARIEADTNDDFDQRNLDHKRDVLTANEKMRLYQDDVKEAVKQRTPSPAMPADCQPPKQPQRRRLYSTEPTIEKAARLLEGSPRGLLLLRDELAGWISGMDRYSGGTGGDRAFWLQAYGGRTWTPDRVKDGAEAVSVPNLTWGIVGTIQPDRVSSLMMGGDDDGLTARFLYVWPEALPPRRPARFADNDGAFEALLRLRGLAWDSSQGPEVKPFTPAAAAALQDWRCEVAQMEADASGLLLSWMGKLPGFAVRLALILEYLAWAVESESEPPKVSELAFLQARTLLKDFALPMARRTFGEAALPQVERDARKLARWLIRQSPLPEIVNAKELRRMANGPGIPDADRMEAALIDLHSAGLVRPRPARASGYGRRRKDYEVNPALAEAAP